MISYILETVVIQLLFLLGYDLFLKKETFFQWNRVYLLGTFLLSFILPWIKIEALKTTVNTETVLYPEFLIQLDEAQISSATSETTFWQALTWQEWIYSMGTLLMLVWFIVKLYGIHKLRQKGEIQYYPDFTKVRVKKSEVAFSFFRQVFLGDGISKIKEPQILAHELVHIKQRHSLDLMFFELMRIGFWFNPLVYVYQNRISELHEFIADAQVAKENKKEQYEALLSEVFQTQNLSFVNQFFKSSLIKKRIVMLTKEKSRAILQLKYLLLLPLVLAMLFYSSCEKEVNAVYQEEISEEITLSDERLIKEIQAEIDAITVSKELFEQITEIYKKDEKDEDILSKRDFFKKELLLKNMFSKVEKDNLLSESSTDILKRLNLPSSKGYQYYVNRKKTFQILDKNLKLSINQNKKAIRPIVKEDKNLESGEWLVVQNISDLTGDEIKKVNQVLSSVEGTNRMVVISDEKGEYSFLITDRVQPVVLSVEETNDSQNSEIERGPVPFAMVDDVPIFPGCEDATDKKACFQEKMQKHIRKHFNYPQAAQEFGIQGRVAVMFVIDTDGNIKDIRKRGPHELLENEVERIIGRLPQMKPGMHDGKTVEVPFSIPITFKLQQESTIGKKIMPKGLMHATGNLNKEEGTSYFLGNIKDEYGLGLPGANIINISIGEATVSDFDGNFKIIGKKGDQIEFRYIGYDMQTQKL